MKVGIAILLGPVFASTSLWAHASSLCVAVNQEGTVKQDRTHVVSRCIEITLRGNDHGRCYI